VQQVIPAPPFERVIASAAKELVVAARAPERIIAAPPQDLFRLGAAVDQVVEFRGDQHFEIFEGHVDLIGVA